MESNGVEGNIMVSEATKTMLCIFLWGGEVGKNNYLIEREGKNCPYIFTFEKNVKIEKF